MASKARTVPSFLKQRPSSRLALARLDRSMPVNEEKLLEAVRSKVAIPAVSRINFINGHRTRQGLGRVSAEDLRDLFFIPIRFPGAYRQERRLNKSVRSSTLWNRSEFFTPSGTFIYKGVGTSPTARRMREIISEARNEAPQQAPTRGFGAVITNERTQVPEHQFWGGLRKGAVLEVLENINTIQNEYRKAILQRDPVALEARQAGFETLPLPEHIGAFEPLQVPAITLYDLERLGKKRTPLRIRRIAKDCLINLSKKSKDQWRVWLYAAPHANRTLELAEAKPRPFKQFLASHSVTIGRTQAYLGGKPVAPAKAEQHIMDRHVKSTAAVIHIANHRLGWSLSGGVMGSVLSPQNTGPGGHFDWDTVETATREKYREDIRVARQNIRMSRVGVGRPFFRMKIALAESMDDAGKDITIPLTDIFTLEKKEHFRQLVGLLRQGRIWLSRRQERRKNRSIVH